MSIANEVMPCSTNVNIGRSPCSVRKIMNLQRTLQLDVVHIYYTEFSPKASFFENKHIHFAKCGAALAFRRTALSVRLFRKRI